MSNPLQKLINRYLSDNNISRANFAKQLGYSNINKGLKRLDQFLITLDSPNNDIYSLILKNTAITEKELKVAYLKVFNDIKQEKSLEFTPYAMAIPLVIPSPITGMRFYHINVPINITKLAYDDELQAIFNLYKKHRVKIPSSTGFRYFRSYGETLVFDENCNFLKDKSINYFSK